MSKEALNQYTVLERVGTTGTLSLSTTPIAYMENGSYHPNVPELREKQRKNKKYFCNERNNLKVRICEDISDEDNLELETESGLKVQIALSKVIYTNGSEEEVLMLPEKGPNFLMSDREGLPVLIQEIGNGIFYEEYDIGSGIFKKSTILEKYPGDSALSGKVQLRVVHYIKANRPVEIISNESVRTSRFYTNNYFSISDGRDSIDILEPILKDSNKKTYPIYYEVDFLKDNIFKLSYVVDKKILTKSYVKYPMYIDPTATVSRSGSVGTSTTNFTIDLIQPCSWSATLTAYNSGDKSPTINRTYFYLKDGKGTNLASVSRSTNGTSSYSGTVLFEPANFGTCKIQIETTHSDSSRSSGNASVTYRVKPELSWTNYNTQSVGTTAISAAVMNEAQENVKKVITATGASHSWVSGFPVSAGDIVNLAHLTELRTGLDKADNSNVCTHKANNSGVYSNHSDNYHDNNYSDDSYNYHDGDSCSDNPCPSDGACPSDNSHQAHLSSNRSDNPHDSHRSDFSHDVWMI